MFAGTETPTGLGLDARCGGSPFNLAVGLARLAQPVAFFGAVSRDFFGERLMRALHLEGVDTLPSTVRAVHVGSYTTVVEPIASTPPAPPRSRAPGAVPICQGVRKSQNSRQVAFPRSRQTEAFFQPDAAITAANSTEVSHGAATEATCPDRDPTAADRFVDLKLPRGFPRDAEEDS